MFARAFGILLATSCLVLGAARGEPAPPVASPALPAPDADGFVSLFDGHDLAGWQGLPEAWSVKEGAISGHQTKAGSKQTFLVRSGLIVRNFELRFKYRFASAEGNSGLQFRSTVIDRNSYRVGGYQADFDAQRIYDGSIYDEAGVAGNRGTLSNRGERTTWHASTHRTSVPLEAAGPDLLAHVNSGGWNDAVLVARGNHMTYSINLHLMTDLYDASPAALKEGCIALQLHQGFTMEVLFKDLRIKALD